MEKKKAQYPSKALIASKRLELHCAKARAFAGSSEHNANIRIHRNASTVLRSVYTMKNPDHPGMQVASA
jgi:hypothetical protein